MIYYGQPPEMLNDDLTKSFTYKGKRYGTQFNPKTTCSIGTCVIIKDKYSLNGENSICKFLGYDNKINKYKFLVSDYKYKTINIYYFVNEAKYICIRENELEDAILEIVCPIIFHYTGDLVYRSVKDSEINGMGWAWLLYIFLMIGSMIFKDFWILWILLSISFFTWRINERRNY